MNIREVIANIFSDWEAKIETDEWYFAKIEKNIIASVQPHEAFEAIPEMVEIILEQGPLNDEDDRFAYMEMVGILSSLVHKSGTTELPPRFEEKLEIITAKVIDFGEYARNLIADIRQWYRLVP